MLQFDVCTYSHQQIQNTRDLLYSIAQHLSSKECCRRQTYTVIIATTEVTFETTARLCRARGDNKSAEPAIWHIIREHFHVQLFHTVKNATTVHVVENSLVPGTYVYEVSVSGKHRRWFKIQ